MTELGSGLHNAEQHEDALIVQEAELATERRIGAHASCLLLVRGDSKYGRDGTVHSERCTVFGEQSQ